MNVDLPLTTELELAEDDGPARGPRTKLAAGAYDPYNVDPKGGPKLAAVKSEPRTDLRKLSEWIKLKREVDELKAAGDAPPPPPRR